MIILHFPERSPLTGSEVSSDKIWCGNHRKRTLERAKTSLGHFINLMILQIKIIFVELVLH